MAIGLDGGIFSRGLDDNDTQGSSPYGPAALSFAASAHTAEQIARNAANAVLAANADPVQ